MYTHASCVYVCTVHMYICTSRAYPTYELVLTLFNKIPSGMHIHVFDCDFLVSLLEICVLSLSCRSPPLQRVDYGSSRVFTCIYSNPQKIFEEKKHPIGMMVKCVPIFWILLVFLFSSPSACRFWSLGPFSEVDKAEGMMDSRVFLGLGAEMGPHWGLSMGQG